MNTMTKRRLSFWRTRNLATLVWSFAVLALTLFTSVAALFGAKNAAACDGTPPPSQWCAIHNSDYTRQDYQDYLDSREDQRKQEADLRKSDAEKRTKALERQRKEVAARICKAPEGVRTLRFFVNDVLWRDGVWALDTFLPNEPRLLSTTFQNGKLPEVLEHDLHNPGIIGSHRFSPKDAFLVEGMVYVRPSDGTIPLYVSQYSVNEDEYLAAWIYSHQEYHCSFNESERKVLEQVRTNVPYQPQMTVAKVLAGYILQNPRSWTVPVKIYASRDTGFEIAITSKQADDFAIKAGYSFSRIAGYVAPGWPICQAQDWPAKEE